MPSVPSWAVALHDRHGRRANWVIWSLVMLLAAGFYIGKAADDGSAFVRWRHQVPRLWQGENIYDEMMFPNPPIMPITLSPLMLLPKVPGATLWFLLKVGMAAASAVLCFRMAASEGRAAPPWVEGLVLLLSLRPILSDLHHGNINLLILFLIVTSLYAWRRGYDVLAGILLALAIAYKVTPALFVPYFVYKRSWRTVGGTMAGLVLFFLVVPSLFLGFKFNAECLSMWWHRILSPYIVHGVKGDQEINQSMVGVVSRLLTQPANTEGRYGHQLIVNLVAWDPARVGLFIKALSLGFVGMLALLCRTRTMRRDDPRLLGEFALVVLTMLFVSERSWKHHFVTLLLPYAYLGYRLVAPWVGRRGKGWVAGALALSALLMASTSSELGGLVADHGHKIAQGYGMFFWAAMVLYVATAWRVAVERDSTSVNATAGPVRSAPPQPHFGSTVPSSRASG